MDIRPDRDATLRGLRVVDLGQYLAAPLVTTFLADHGADVVHIDPPGGPRWKHPANAMLYRNKRAVELDLKSEAGRSTALRLIDTADVVVDGFRPGGAARLGLDPGSRSERLIWCSIPGFPSDHPDAGLAGWEGIVASAAGLYPQPGFVEGDPVFSALPLASNFAAFLAAHRVLGALLGRAGNGRGRHLEVSMFEACFEAIGFAAEFPASRSFGPRFGEKLAPLLRQRSTSDESWLYFDTPLRGLQAFLDRFLPGNDLLTMTEEDVHRVSTELDDLIRTRTGAEWERIGQQEVGGSFGASSTTAEWLDDRHTLDSETVLQVEDGQLGPTRQAGYPVRMSASAQSVRWGRGSAPKSGADPLDWFDPPWTDPAASGPDTGLPLAGLRVLDCATLLAGPTASRVLAQYGAEVIKIDRAGIATGDIDPRTDDGLTFFGGRTVQAGKRMTFVDLKHPDGQAILRTLIRGADIVHHNFTPDAAHRLGVDFRQLRELTPDIIATTMSLHSYGGFRAAYRGHDMLGQMSTGVCTRMGGDGPPRIVSTVINDNAAGHLHTFGIMLAVLHRRRTGVGQEVNSSLSRTATLHQVPFMVGYEGRVWDEPSGPAARGWHALDRLYHAADGWFYLATGSDGLDCLASCSILPGVVDVEPDSLGDWLEERFATLSGQDCVDALRAAGVAAHRHRSLTELVLDAYVTKRRLITAEEHPGIGPALGIGLPTYDAEPGRVRMLAARRPGADTLGVLIESGFGEHVAELMENGVVATGEMPLMNTTAVPGFWAMHALSARQGGVLPMAEVIDRIRSVAPDSLR